jgi:NADH-quinone oxidoreductase subunit C
MPITATSTVVMVREKFPQAIVETSDFRGEQTLVLQPEHLAAVCTYLQKTLRYTFLSSVTAVDWLERAALPRYDVVYHLLSIPNQCELRLKLRVGKKREDHPAVPSVTGIWPASNWYEREVYDLFGIIFTGHPDLRRILMPMDWTTHPLRKDYPLSGFDLPEPHWGGQVPYDVDPGVGSQTLRTPFSRELNESRSKISQDQEPGTEKK